MTWSNDMSDKERDSAGPASARGSVIAGPQTQTPSGAPTDQAHKDVGDGTLVGSIPAGLSLDELQKIADNDQSVESGTS
jgi:hypothetical protein